MRNYKEAFIRNYTNALLQGEAAIFAGAGLSSESGYVNWKGLLKNITSDLNLDIDKESDLITVAQYYLNESGGNRYNINKEILDNFTKRSKSNETLEKITSLPISTFWTTNYDSLIEDTLKDKYKKIVDVKKRQEQLATNLNNRDAVVYKFHGDISDANNAIITRDDYEMFTFTHDLYITALKGDLVSKTFVFVGYGLNDPNFLQVLSNIRVLIGKNAREHYCFIKKINRKDYELESEYVYAVTKQELYVKDIQRYGIRAVIIEEYSDIKTIFERIKNRYLSNKIFIAGSCRDYGLWSVNDAYQLLNGLGYRLIKDNNTISTGLIEGVGPQLVSGVLAAINEDNLRIEKHLSIKTLPLIKGDASHIKKEAKMMFQHNMISEVGIIIILFGNQFYDNELKVSKGVLADFQRAKEQKKYIIPVGATGNAAAIIFEEVKSNLASYSYLKPFLDSLENEKNPTKLTDTIISAVNHIKSLN